MKPTMSLVAIPNAAPVPRRRVMIVEPDVAAADALARLLDDGATSIVHLDRADAAHTLALAPELVIGGLPALGGEDFAFVRALAHAEETPPILVLALVDEEARAHGLRALRAGAVDYVVRPVSAAELNARIDVHVQHARRTRALWVASYRDPLTGLLNRRGLHDLLGREIERSRRAQQSLALLFVDLDGFKQVNDRHGHDVGDALLRRVGELISAEVRAGDAVARLGGDEFVAVLPRRDRAGAQSLATRLEARLSCALPHGQLGASVGVAALAPRGAPVGGAEELLRRADHAMYARKHRRAGNVAQSQR